MVAFCRARLRAKSLFSSNICEGVAWICEYSNGGYEQRLLRAPVRHNTLNTLLAALQLEYSNVPLPHRFSSKRETARSVQGILKHINVISQQKTVTEWPENQLITCRFSSTLISCKVHVVDFLKCFSFLFL